MQTVFITGANGFIGQNLVEQLRHKYHLLTPTRQELDLLDEKKVDQYFKSNDVDVVIHSAIVGGSIQQQEVSSALSDNLRIFFHLVKNSHHFKKMVQFGTGGEYDKDRSLVKIKETDFGKHIPQDDYCLYKYASAKIIENLDNIVNLRIFGLFGKYDDYRLRFISNSICRTIKGLPLVLNQNRIFDYMYIYDFVKIVDHFLSHKTKYRFYNIGTGANTSLLSIIKTIKEVAKSNQTIKIIKPGLGYEYTCDNSRLKRELGDFSFTDTKTAIQSLYDWHYRHSKEIFL